MRVLLVEDSQLLQESVGFGLRKFGCAVDVTGDGSTGLWYAQSIDYDVIILDIMLPGIDGLTLLQRLRSLGRSAHVLILTARDTVADRVRGLQAGADDYLIKPFSFDDRSVRPRVRAAGIPGVSTGRDCFAHGDRNASLR
jgi:DNA-binding response OmpR family regulator